MFTYIYIYSLVVELVKNPPAMKETPIQILGWEDPLEKGMRPTPVVLPGEFHGQRSLACCDNMTNSLCCIFEINTTFKINYTSIFFKKSKLVT